MKTTYGLSVAALIAALTISPALADSTSNTLNKVVDGAKNTVSNTVDGVSNTTNGGDVSGTVKGVTNSLSGGDVTNTVGNVTGNSGDTSGSTGDIGKTGDIGSFGDFLDELNAGNLDNVGNASDIGQVSEIHFVNVNDAFKDFNANALNDALSNNSTQIANLQNSLNGNSAITKALDGNNVSLTKIIGVDNNQNGSLTIYTDQAE